MATCGADRTVKLWEPMHGNHTMTLSGAPETLLSVCFTCDGRAVLGGGKDIRMWEVCVWCFLYGWVVFFRYGCVFVGGGEGLYVLCSTIVVLYSAL